MVPSQGMGRNGQEVVASNAHEENPGQVLAVHEEGL
jgi:hypothetical protein